jgi:hypothetical protein
LTESLLLDGPEKWRLLAGSYAGFDEITHRIKRKIDDQKALSSRGWHSAPRDLLTDLESPKICSAGSEAPAADIATASQA